MLYIIRNKKLYGPYDEATVAEYVNQGTVVGHDVAKDAATGEEDTVAYFLRRRGLNTYVRHDGGVWKQLKKIGSDLIVPKGSLVNKEWMKDKRLLVLAIVGLFPTLMLLLPMPEIGVFYVMALYFSCIWGLFFYYFFKTTQVTLRTTITVFFMTHFFVFIVWDIFGLVRFNPFYALTESPFPIDLLGFVFGVGLTEELAKMVPLFIIARRAKEPILPRTLVFYGLMAGIAFGVFEGVQYQTTVNVGLDYTSAFYGNIARLTSLPFLHAIWCGIAGYFIAFANLYPRYRHALYFLAVAIPALMHGLYDTFCQGWILMAVIISFIGVFLLMTYLRRSGDYQSRLKGTRE